MSKHDVGSLLEAHMASKPKPSSMDEIFEEHFKTESKKPKRKPGITFVQGDATDPVVKKGERVIVHCCNNRGKWGSGFVVAVEKRWPLVAEHYRLKQNLTLGSTAVIQAADNLYVANIIGQDGILSNDGPIPPIRYEALRLGFNRVVSYFGEVSTPTPTIHLPRIGCGLAGGDWALIEPLIHATFIKSGYPVWVYDFPGGKFYDSRDNSTSPIVR